MELNKPVQFDPPTNPASVAQRWKVRIHSFERYVLAVDITNNTRKTALLLNIAGNEVANIFDSLLPSNELTV